MAEGAVKGEVCVWGRQTRQRDASRRGACILDSMRQLQPYTWGVRGAATWTIRRPGCPARVLAPLADHVCRSNTAWIWWFFCVVWGGKCLRDAKSTQYVSRMR